MITDLCKLEQRYFNEMAATFQVQIRSYEDRMAKGTIMFMLDKTVLPFSGLDQMCLLAEEYLLRKEVFEETVTARRLISRDVIIENWQEHLQRLQKEMVYGHPHKFVIRFLAQGNQSLQGELRVENKKCYFRSGMELMRLMHQWLQLKYESPEYKFPPNTEDKEK